MSMTLNKRNAVIYQIYPQSFVDTDGNGIGDIKGIITKLDYLQELGVDYIWLSPIFMSPLVDNGYDVSDYKKVNPIYGTNEDLYKLFEEGNKRGIGIMLDMVWNHSSDKHEWFQKALAGDKKYQDYYFFSKPDAKGNPPSDWNANFSTKAWTYVKDLDMFYYHCWAPEQPDLNWHNKDMRDELKAVAQFWIDKGAKGFRFDVFNLIGKRMDSLHYSEKDGYMAWDFFGNGPDCHAWWQECGKEVFWKSDILTVGEGNESIADSIWYTAPEQKKLHSMFNFMQNEYGWKKPGDRKDPKTIKDPMNKYIEVFRKGGHLSVAFNNHDNPRMLNKLLADDMTHRYKLATSLSVLQMLWYGNAYIYQGDEFGMINASFKTIEEYKDIGATNYVKAARKEGKSDKEILEHLYWTSRDNARCPMVWNNTKDHGFGSSNPWLDFTNNPQYSLENDLKSDKSIFKFMQEMIKFRKSNADLIQNGDLFPMYRFHNQIQGFFRQQGTRIVKVFINFSDKPAKLTDFNLEGKIIINNADEIKNNELAPYQTLVIETKSRLSLTK